MYQLMYKGYDYMGFSIVKKGENNIKTKKFL